jgi:hypothetical protein
MMKRSELRFRHRSVIGALVVLATGQVAWGQDPAVVNAKTIQVELENDRVRVLEAVELKDDP